MQCNDSDKFYIRQTGRKFITRLKNIYPKRILVESSPIIIIPGFRRLENKLYYFYMTLFWTHAKLDATGTDRLMN